MPLTELMIKQAKPEEKTYMLSDGKGLSLEVRPNGKKYWIIRYWVNKKERRTSGGVYPDVTLKEARDKNYEFRKSLESGKPIGHDTEVFSTVVAEWLEKRVIPTVSQGYLETVNGRLRIVIDYKPYMETDHKVYVSLIEVRYKDGRLMPLSVIWEDEQRYKIDKVLNICKAASLKAGGAGMRYTIRVKDRETYLFFEEDRSGGKWFMERKTS